MRRRRWPRRDAPAVARPRRARRRPAAASSQASAARMWAATQISIWVMTIQRVVVGDGQVGGHNLSPLRPGLAAEVEVIAVQHADRLITAQVLHRPRRERHHHPVDRVDIPGAARAAEGEDPAASLAVVIRGRVPDADRRPTRRCRTPHVRPTEPTIATSGSARHAAQLGREAGVEELGVLVEQNQCLEPGHRAARSSRRLKLRATDPAAAWAEHDRIRLARALDSGTRHSARRRRA